MILEYPLATVVSKWGFPTHCDNPQCVKGRIEAAESNIDQRQGW